MNTPCHRFAPVKRRLNGSIDTSHYLARGRAARSRAAQGLIAAGAAAVRRALRHHLAAGNGDGSPQGRRAG